MAHLPPLTIDGSSASKQTPLSASESNVPRETRVVWSDPESEGHPPIPTSDLFYAQQTPCQCRVPLPPLLGSGLLLTGGQASPHPCLSQTLASDLVSLFMVVFTQRSLIMLGWGLCLGTEQQPENSPNTCTSQKGLATTETAGDEEGGCHNTQ